MEQFRDAAAGGITALGHTPVRTEDFGATARSPQQACLEGVRSSEIVVLILGRSYGAVQPFGGSATHEEYREALREAIPILAFIQAGVDRDPEQERFVREVQDWESGRFTVNFRTEAELRDQLVGALHRLERSLSSGRADVAEMLERGRAAVPRSANTATLVVITVAGPGRTVIRPAELNAADLQQWLMKEAMFGESPVLDLGAQTDGLHSGSNLVVRQREKSVHLDEMGTVVTMAPAIAPRPRFSGGLSAMIEEDIREQIARSLRFVGRVLDRIDPTARVTDALPAAGLINSGVLPWRTRAEQQESPNTSALNVNQPTQVVVTLNPPLRRRTTLWREADAIAADLTELIARHFRPR